MRPVDRRSTGRSAGLVAAPRQPPFSEENTMKSRYDFMQLPQQRRRFALFRTASAAVIVVGIFTMIACLPREDAATDDVATLPPMASAASLPAAGPAPIVEQAMP
jgi:hypothetical protein